MTETPDRTPAVTQPQSPPECASCVQEGGKESGNQPRPSDASPPIIDRAPQLAPYRFKKGAPSGNPEGRRAEIFNLRRRAREHGAAYFDALEQWAFGDDWRAAIPALRILLGAGFGEFDKIPPETGALPAGYENMSTAERLRELTKRRAELALVAEASKSALAAPVKVTNPPTAL